MFLLSLSVRKLKSLLFFNLPALLSAVHVTEQLPAEPHAAGRPAVQAVQGGVLEERSISLESTLRVSLPICRTPPRPAAL